MKMKFLSASLISFLVLFLCSCQTGNKKPDDKALNVTFIENEAGRKVDVMIDDRLFTTFCWPENVYKPILYPVYTSAGTEITEDFL